MNYKNISSSTRNIYFFFVYLFPHIFCVIHFIPSLSLSLSHTHTHTHTHIYIYTRVSKKLCHILITYLFANDPVDRGSIPGRIIPKTLKCYLIPPCLTLSNIRYVSRVKWSNCGKGVASSPTPRCSSYWKGSHLVTLNYGRQLYFLFVLFFKLQQKQSPWCNG